ncbi:uncharacterized protein LY89DRAFT_716682 [Mollisia scopiformis]|uniref:RING-type domain-containing protein n=1 Tax=Mollisia scopiformis TaxID=149040 RepID=A0A194XG02_MOLSC|nr:uncharacterized protein LY89DRAFT_716682 [Mollisia scopiformis]KUJ19071.1 hypothetical protein LY89DRAFT_716682 [Mollisia scopiformis]
MAASTITPAQAELISSLSQDEIPIKLRCAICSRLAVNAFRLPCCDQAICEHCHSELSSTCAVCEHTPISAEDCKPNKSLRTTIKVFLRTEEKKREALRLKEEKNTPPDTPITVEPTPAGPVAPVEEPAPANDITNIAEEKDEKVDIVTEPSDPPLPTTLDPEQAAQAEQDIPQPSIEEIAPGQESTGELDTDTAEVTQNGEESIEKDINGHSAVPQTPGFGAGFGFDPSAAGGFPGMGFGGDFNQMQMMMAMQNGMGGGGGFGNFPMMGMPGMDPMAMQNMFLNGGFGAGMNGMNMGMGIGFEGGVGAGFNNGWNGQSWNVGDNFNPNAASMAHGHGDYGANNSGYASHTAGFNQGNYGRGNHYNDYQNNYGSQGFRGRGRGRGGHGRGGYYGPNEAFSHQIPQQYGNQQSNGPISETGSIPKGPKTESEPAPNVDEFGRELRPDTKEDTPKVVDDESAVKPQERSDNPVAELTTDAVPQEPESLQDSNAPMPIQTLDDVDTEYNVDNYGAGGYGQSHLRGARGGSYSAMQPPVKPLDVPINAPTGPKAMREGLPNTSIYNMRGRGYIPGGVSSRPSGSASVSVAPDVSEKGDEREHSRSPSRGPDRSKERSRSRSRNRQRSRSRDRHHRRHRHRSASLTEDDKETERRRERRREKERERHRRHEEETVDDGPGERVETDDVPENEKSRSASPSGSRRSGHVSRREKDKYRERDRDSDKDRKSSHRHRSRRSHRDDRERSRSRDRERDSHRRRSRHYSEEPQPEPKAEPSVAESPVEAEEIFRKPSIIEIKGASERRKHTLDDIKIPTGPRSDRIPSSTSSRDFKEKRSHDDRPSRHESSRSGRNKDRQRDRGYDREKEREKEKDRSVPSTPAKDPHELEREARNRERLLKEAQRIAGLTAAVGRKRSRDDGDEGLAGKGRRKKGRRSGVIDENEEARLARLEAERENNRWN